MELAIRIQNAKKTLFGVSIGDAFGDSFFGDEDKIMECIHSRTIPETRWEFTDDTVMSIAIYEELITHNSIEQNHLVQRFIRNHNLDPNRGYGATLRRVLREIQEGGHWHEVAKNVFDGQGSMGNGAAMRVCPIGAFYFDDLEKVKVQATQSAEVTHANPEAIAGAIAIAIGTALTSRMGIDQKFLTPLQFINMILAELPDTDTKFKIAKALEVPYNYHIETVKRILGNGINMTAQDTVPFVIWCTAHNLKNFHDGLWKAVSALGDRDTICAMVGGMLIMSSEETTIPPEWIKSVESVDDSIFLDKS